MTYRHRSDDRGMSCRTRDPLAVKAWERVSAAARHQADQQPGGLALPIAYDLVRRITGRTWADCGPGEWRRIIEKMGGEE